MSYTHLLYHIVFATKDRMPLIAESWETELYRYLGGIIKGQGGEPIEINGMPQHAHILARLKPLPALPDFMRELKASSSKWAKRHEPKFSWQRPYGAFTVSESKCGAVREYIRNQKAHHANQPFQEELTGLLRLHHVEFDERYLWDRRVSRVSHASWSSYRFLQVTPSAAPVAKVMVACSARSWLLRLGGRE